MKYRACTDLCAIRNDYVCANAGFRMHFSFIGNSCRRVDASGRAGFGIKERDNLGKGQTGTGYANKNLAFGSKVFVNDNGAGRTLLCAFKKSAVFSEG